MSDSTQVDPDALLAFANAVSNDLEAYPGLTGSALLPAGLASIGGSGMQEAVWAGSAHAAALDAARQFVADTCDGLLALGYVAATVADHYRHGDADQAAQMAAVTNALEPPSGQPSLAARREEAAAAQAAAQAAAALATAERARFLNQLDRGTTDGEQLRFQNQVDAAGRPSSPPTAMGGATAGYGQSSSRYTRYVDEVRSHNAFVSGGTGGATAEDEYSPRAQYDAAVDEAEFRTRRDGIPWVVQVDEHGRSEVVQADPDDEPVVPRVDYTEQSSAPAISPSVLSFGD